MQVHIIFRVVCKDDTLPCKCQALAWKNEPKAWIQGFQALKFFFWLHSVPFALYIIIQCILSVEFFSVKINGLFTLNYYQSCSISIFPYQFNINYSVSLLINTNININYFKEGLSISISYQLFETSLINFNININTLILTLLSIYISIFKAF